MDAEQIEAFIFYFDLIGVREQFMAKPTETLQRIRQFQRAVRQSSFPFGGPHTTLKTLADNVWARINANDGQIADVRLLELAGNTMRAAGANGFNKFFGVITRGLHVFELEDRILVSYGDPTDIAIQHIDMTSEPHMRAAVAEKWSAALAKTRRSPVSANTVWISEEVLGEGSFEDNYCGVELPVTPIGDEFDLKNWPVDGRDWPFERSRFRAVGLVAGRR